MMYREPCRLTVHHRKHGPIPAEKPTLIANRDARLIAEAALSSGSTDPDAVEVSDDDNRLVSIWVNPHLANSPLQ